MEQQIRFREVDSRRVAYATVGEGPPLVLPAYWGSHLELEWTFPEYRAFISALAEDRTVIRYDRLGTGLSDRVRPDPPDVEAELRTLQAVIGDREPVSLLGISWGACVAAAYAARRPVDALTVVGGFANGAEAAPAPLREAILATVRAHWGTGSRMLADVWVPGADAAARDAFAQLQRAAADAETAAVMLEAIYATDVRDLLADIQAPTLVVHRRGDRAIPFEMGRDLAARIPGARLVALEGEIHLPWLGDRDAVLRALGAGQAEPVADGGPLSAREQEVLRLIADGLSDADIAERLIVSPHTVHRHVANIRTKLRQPSRAAAAAHAVREGLI
jgi:pimeloyl-ACP methyl ester carboxylesterase/DNA-binding CsgD family transcriptional regulator